MSYSYEESLIEIKKWNMDATEATVFKLCLLWEETVEKELKGIALNHVTKLRKKGDPRKSTLFKYCWKLFRETNGLIPINEYRLYIRAQIQVFKNLERDFGKRKEGEPRIDAQILCGPKAWMRWMYWKNLYLKQTKVDEHAEKVQTEATDGYAYKVGMELAHTKAFMEKQAGGEITKDFIKQICSDRTLLRWVTFGKVSPFYVILSPWVTEAYGNTFEKANNVKLGVYVESTNEAVKEHFKQHFGQEMV